MPLSHYPVSLSHHPWVLPFGCLESPVESPAAFCGGAAILPTTSSAAGELVGERAESLQNVYVLLRVAFCLTVR